MGECRNAIERGKWGHPSSQHSCTGSAPRRLERGVGPPEQPTGLHRPRAPLHTRPDHLARKREPPGVELVYRGGVGRSARKSATHDHHAEPNRTPCDYSLYKLKRT
jgi:hypothetical protein